MAATLSRLTAESRGRVEDYLNDKFQNISDLENIDNLLAKIHEQQDLLKQQLMRAQEEQTAAEEDLETNASALKVRALQHDAEQLDISRRMQILTQSEVSDDAIKNFDEPMRKLRRIEIAEGYVKTMQVAAGLEQRARDQPNVEPRKAVEAYKSLELLVQDLESAQPAAEGAAPHLLDHLSNSRQALYEHLRARFEEQLRKSLDGIKWPKKDIQFLGEPANDWSAYTLLLLQLQEPPLAKHSPDSDPVSRQEPVILLPLAVMVHPLAQRFRFHFYGDKPTNRLDKPEYFFNHILDLLDQHHVFITSSLQPILDTRTREDDRLDLTYTDAVSSFITALLPMVSAKCLSILPHLISQPQLMSHFIREIMSFDTALQQSWAYSPVPGPLTEWKGLTWDMLTKHGYFDAWLRLEKDFALSRYRKIRDSPESRDIDYDGVEQGRTKPTKGAIRVNDLLETITDRYRRLSSFSQKMKFLMDIQLSIFDDYHNHLHEHFLGYRTNSHTTGRAITGQSANEAMGMPGLQTLVKIFGSAEYLERKMSDWSDDVFFLELWEELQDRASQTTGARGTVGRNLSVEEVASRTSGTLRNTDEMLESDAGALFDETATSYRQLRESSEAEIVRLLQVNVRNAIRPLQNVSIWTTLSNTTTDILQLAPSSALDTFNQVITPLLDFLAKVLAVGPLRRITKLLCLTVQEEVYDRLLMKHSFSAAGATQLKRDVLAISTSIDSSIGLHGETQRHFGRLNDATTLLSLPIKSSRNSAGIEGAVEVDDWGFDDEGDAVTPDDNAVGDPADEIGWGLWQAEKAVFADNASARKALESMGLSDLSESDARNVIRRRIEVNS